MNQRLYVSLACAIALLNGCAPLPMYQEASLVPKGKDKVGMAGTIVMPLAPETRWQPDGELTPEASAKQPDLQYYPLPSVTGWIRRGNGWGESQASISMPSFIITLASKLGIVGLKPGSPFSMALSAEINFAPITASASAGATLFLSTQVGGGVSLDLSTRVGNFTGVWRGLGASPTLGVSIPLDNGSTFHIGAGANIPTGVGESSLACWLIAGATLK